MEVFDTLIPEIVQSATDWVEDRYGKFAGWVAFFALIVGVPAFGIVLIVLWAAFGG